MIRSIAKLAFIVLLLGHGLIHLLGFLKAFDLAPVNQLALEISRPVGLLWLLAALLFVVTAVALVLKMRWWWATASVAALLSQVLIFTAWQDAGVGSIANLIILAVALLHLGSVRFEGRYRQDVRNGQERVRGLPAETITEADLQTLPQPVQRYLRYAGVVGKPKVVSMVAEMTGEMRQQGRASFPLTAEQHNFFDRPARLFFMKGRLFGLTVPGYHGYQDKRARMDVRLFGLLPLVKVDGAAMFEADTVSAMLYFNDEGQLVNFISHDRWDVSDMKQYPWSTPVSRYRNLNGANLPTYGEAIWHYPDGDFVYGRLKIENVAYNA